MKQALRACLLAGCLALLALIVGVRLVQSRTHLLGAQLVDETALSAITALPQTGTEGCVLHLDQTVLPYDAQAGAYCLPQPLQGEASGSLSASWGSVYLPAEGWGGGWQQAMESGEVLPVYVSDGKRWCLLQAYVSGMPVLNIRTQYSEPYKLDPSMVSGTMASMDLAYYYGEYTLFWPEGNQRQQVQQGLLEYHWRGNTNLLADKKAYRLNLLDEKGQPDGQDLLGLGSDADWILMNFATDVTRSRDKVAWQLWQQLVQQNEYDLPGIQVEYVELYIDDQYMGVYGLARTISRDSLGLSANDRLYKWRTMPMDRSMPTPAVFESLEQQQSLAWGLWLEVSWPKTYSAGLWQPMARYVSTYYTVGAQNTWQQLEQLANLQNMVDVSLFRQFVCAMDNFSYNQFFMYDDSEERFYRILWDLDYTFGNLYDEFYPLDMTSTAIPDMELDALYAADPQRTRQLVAQRWAQLRETVFTMENVQALFAQAADQLQSTGALARDWALWGEAETYPWAAHFRTLNVEDTMEFMRRRLAFLDEYMAAYTPADREAFDVLPQ